MIFLLKMLNNYLSATAKEARFLVAVCCLMSSCMNPPFCITSIHGHKHKKATCKHAPLKWNQTGWLQLMEFSSCRCRFEAEARLHNMWY
uniref:Uncharacterized protein n=1 Tax=Oryza sativa subsp. indica TaxID=39946 RepID=A0A679B983_ORYSI|nr:hypothetical protein [Oryza sativa Indica Group]BBD82357.1 hypothetical protein [Oryza sativa Indica Group]